MIYTSHFEKIPEIPKDIVVISISGKAPDWYDGIQYKVLAPKRNWWIDWKNNHHDNEIYKQKYHETVLDTLNVDNIVNRLYELSEGKDVVLLCYEKPNEFCHRHIVAQWLRDNGIECIELQLS